MCRRRLSIRASPCPIHNGYWNIVKRYRRLLPLISNDLPSPYLFHSISFSGARDAAPAAAICSSSCDCAPDTPTAPTHSPSYITGTPHWIDRADKFKRSWVLFEQSLGDPCRNLQQGGSTRLALRYLCCQRASTVEALTFQKSSCRIDDGDRDMLVPASAFPIQKSARGIG